MLHSSNLLSKVLKCHDTLFHQWKQLIVNVREWNKNMLFIKHYQKKNKIKNPQRNKGIWELKIISETNESGMANI